MRPLAATVPSSVDSAPTGTSRAFKRMRRVQALPDVPAAAAIPDDAAHRQTCTHYLQGVALDPEGEALAYFKRDKHGKTAASDAEMHIVLPLIRKYMCIPGSNHRVERLWSSARNMLGHLRLATTDFGTTLILRVNMQMLGIWPRPPLKFK